MDFNINWNWINVVYGFLFDFGINFEIKLLIIKLLIEQIYYIWINFEEFMKVIIFLKNG